jgi:pSer/pThr/pTyr-binding forkhead associated (FHA) protein
MPAYDQLELIAPSGEIKFYDLDPSRGITNIGRHPENDIVIDNPAVAPFHAVLDHRQRPYQLVVVTQENPTSVGGESVAPNVPHVLNTWDTIELNGHSLVLVEGGSGGRAPFAAAPRASAATSAAAVLPVVTALSRGRGKVLEKLARGRPEKGGR